MNELADTPTVNAALNVLQLAVLLGLLKWVRHGCENLAETVTEAVRTAQREAQPPSPAAPPEPPPPSSFTSYRPRDR